MISLFWVYAGVAASVRDGGFFLKRDERQLMLNSNGAVVAWTGLLDTRDTNWSASAGQLQYQKQTLRLEAPQAVHTAEGLKLTFRWAAVTNLEVIIDHRVGGNRDTFVWTREIEIRGPTRLASDLSVSLQSWPNRYPTNTWLPLLDGTGGTLSSNQAAGFRFAGDMPETGVLLALPMLSVPSNLTGLVAKERRLMFAADPYFSTLFRNGNLEWTYLAKGGLEHGCERRTLIVADHAGSIDDSLAYFFRYALAGNKPGPEWLHSVALVDFDYLSDGGQGWFRDVDALAAALPKRERHQVFLCLHGWYDFLGRYCFDAKTKKLDQEWTAFSSYEAARNAHPLGKIGGEQVSMGFANCKPVKMSLAEVHRRLQYARSHGFRVGLYFADGMNAGDGLPDFAPDRVLEWGGWQGPDSKGKSYFQNPLHPRVHAFFVDYTKALLAEFGLEADALVWDETFHVPCGRAGTEAWPGYADRAMMRLARELTASVEAFNGLHRRQVAFLTSDCLGAFGNELKGPYALVSHGTYQDSWCQPRAWSYGIFANYRNVLWSCCWWPMTKWKWVEFGVRNYQAPVSLSNGWGDDCGFSEMTPAQRARAVALFQWRKQHPTRLRWLERLPEPPETLN